MRIIAIEESDLDELVEAVLARLRLAGDGEEKSLSFRKVNYEVRTLVGAVKGRKL